MKKLLIFLPLLLIGVQAFACPACEKQQPKLLKGISHGTGPSGPMDMVIVWSMVALVLFTLIFSLKWIFKPGEKSATHIKRYILNND